MISHTSEWTAFVKSQIYQPFVYTHKNLFMPEEKHFHFLVKNNTFALTIQVGKIDFMRVQYFFEVYRETLESSFKSEIFSKYL